MSFTGPALQSTIETTCVSAHHLADALRLSGPAMRMDLLEALLVRAEAEVESITGRIAIARPVEERIVYADWRCEWEVKRVEVTYPDLRSVTSFQWQAYNSDGPQDIDPSELFVVDGDILPLPGERWPWGLSTSLLPLSYPSWLLPYGDAALVLSVQYEAGMVADYDEGVSSSELAPYRDAITAAAVAMFEDPKMTAREAAAGSVTGAVYATVA